MDRLNSHIKAVNPSNNSINNTKSHDDIVIVSAIRTPICKAKKGSFNSTGATSLLVPVFKKLLSNGINPSLVDEIIVGSVLGNGTIRHAEVRMAGFLAGIPTKTTVQVVNRQCSSSLQAIATAAAGIKAGYYSVVIAAGVETMSLDAKFKWTAPMDDKVPNVENARDCLIPMGITSENVTEKYKLKRIDLDKISSESHRKAFNAKIKFSEEIVPVTTNKLNLETNQKERVTVTEDEGVRENCTFETLSKIKPAFKPGGSTTAGNSSQVSDGAAGVLLLKRSKALSLNLPILGTFLTFRVEGVPPAIMGVGPVYAIPKAINSVNLNLNDIDLFEINEAFASQFLYSVDKLKIPMNKVNVNGGAIALGHPLGCTGARMTVTLLNEMKRRKNKLGVVSMCIGTGMGAAAIFAAE